MLYICSMNIKLYRHPAPHEAVAGGPGNPAGPENKHGYEAIVDGQTIHFAEPEPTGREILMKTRKIPPTCFSLYIKLKGCDFERVSPDQGVDLRKNIEHFVTKEPDVFPYTINKDPELTEEKLLTPVQISQNVVLDPEKDYLVEIEESGEHKSFAFTPAEPIRMHCRGLHFYG